VSSVVRRGQFDEAVDWAVQAAPILPYGWPLRNCGGMKASGRINTGSGEVRSFAYSGVLEETRFV